MNIKLGGLILLAIALSGCVTTEPVVQELQVSQRRDMFDKFFDYQDRAASMRGDEAVNFAIVLNDKALDFGLSASQIETMNSLPLEQRWPFIDAYDKKGKP